MLKVKEKKAVEEYKDILVDFLAERLDSIILFGSKAINRDKKDSDIDLMILRTDNPKDPHDHIWQKIVEYSGEMTLKYGNIDISPRVESKNLFKKTYSPFFERVKKDGVIIWNQKTNKSL